MPENEFFNPSSFFTPLPFWFWNDALTKDEIKRQILDFNQKGVNGFIIHPRIGIPKDIEYMSERFLDLVKFAVETAAQNGMIVVLYDEAMYPSGSAHGMVVKHNSDFASKGLTTTSSPKHGDKIVCKINNTYYVQRYSGGVVRGIHFGEDDGEKDAPKSADLLNPQAMETFIKYTHEKYYSYMGEYFATTIIGMFTDEPSVLGRCAAPNMIPWTDGFMEHYKKFGGCYDDLPHLFDKDPKSAQIKQKYKKAVSALLAKTYYEPISKWCKDHCIALMGHPEKSVDIGAEKYFHVPGQDLVWCGIFPGTPSALHGDNSAMGKCSSDAARHSMKRRNSNECFGACNKNRLPWNFSADDMKWYMDWLFVRGVNMLIPHAFYYSVNDGRAYERPPDVGPNNIWWDDYKQISDYIKRNCALMTDSVNVTDIAVLCTGETMPTDMLSALYENQIEFNYLQDVSVKSENIENGRIKIASQTYNVVVLDKNVKYSPDTLRLLKKYGVRTVYGIDGILKSKKDLFLKPACKDIRISHVVKSGLDFYLVVNEGEDAYSGSLQVNAVGNATLWNAWNGTIEDACIEQSDKSGMRISLCLNRRESVIICVDTAKEPVLRPCVKYEKEKTVYLLRYDGKETLNFKQSFNCPNVAFDKAVLSADDANELFICRINGHRSVKMWKPYDIDITKYLKHGINEVEIEVVPNLVNKYSGTSFKQGILGDVKIDFFKAVK